jgi:DNA-binding NarL/FixJ family response regulator
MNLNTLATYPPYFCCGVSLPAARQIRRLAPQSKIIFVTQEISADIVREVIGLGVMGYVVMTKVQSELLKAIDPVLEEK